MAAVPAAERSARGFLAAVSHFALALHISPVEHRRSLRDICAMIMPCLRTGAAGLMLWQLHHLDVMHPGLQKQTAALVMLDGSVIHCPRCCCGMTSTVTHVHGAVQILQRRSELGMSIPRLLYTVPVGQNPTGQPSIFLVYTYPSASLHLLVPARAHTCIFIGLPVRCNGAIHRLSWTLHANSNSS